ncbi:ElyC/SanA/YdcF family protein, partial [Thomasclavelia cocleata]|uniref:ElyC/SanA/YdcF family protein n=1 Tax=Thomasclavelia cocleata TaxID=69824 RepID=UPI00255AD185
NQLEDTNHDHLGKLITYASGKSADIVIWVVKRAREEHRAAIEWLNNHTDENIAFSLKLINALGPDRNIAVATSEYHQLRAAMICRRYGLNAAPQSSKTKASILHVFLIREIFGIIKEFIINKKYTLKT